MNKSKPVEEERFMKTSEMKDLIIGNLKARLPIIQGGMGVGISLSGLAASVANQGGIGVIATAGIGMQERDFSTNFARSNIRALKAQIQRTREMTRGIIGSEHHGRAVQLFGYGQNGGQ